MLNKAYIAINQDYSAEDSILNTLLHNGVIGLWGWHLETGELWWSSSYYSLLGYEPNSFEVTPEFWTQEVVHPEDQARINAASSGLLNEGKPFKVEFRLKGSNGEYKWYLSQGGVEHDSAGRAARVVGTLTDVHEAVLARLEREKYEFMLDEVSRMAGVGGWEYVVGEARPKWTKGTFDIHELPHGKVPDLADAIRYYDPAYVPTLETAFNLCLSQGEEYEIDLVLITAKQNKRWVRVTGKPMRSGTGQIIGLRGAIQDIHHSKLLELERTQSISLLSSHNNRLQNFAHIVSHNLRSHASNLETLLGFLEHEKDPAQVAELLGMTRFASRALIDTLNNLNDVVRIQSQVNLTKTKVNLKAVVEATLKLIANDVDKASAEIELDFKALKEVEYHLAYAESMVLNLISNALKYRDPMKYCKITVGTYKDPKDFRPCFYVKDNGLGMDLNRVGKSLFGMYKTFHHNPDARGIGLFITKNQIESLGGQIFVESKLGVGTTFTVKF